ncbi:MAG: Arp2 3 complex subunit ARPC5 [Lasallia pustulata]|uniref:Actin-related protein 2/3 complex subunit 5 n=1 Tax=Lasallia pustulata TaxID=136370 RepID=A0A5M8PF80_9LECA|nr:MAG: Arp2 3 complex subunit ARPC5 [Lasallia pustulata]
MASTINWRTINIDLLDPDSAANFDTSSLTPAVAPVSASEVQSLAGQIRQLLRAGDAEGALRGALENAPYGGDSHTKDIHLASVVEVLQSIKQSEMSPILRRIYQSDGGSALLDVLMKYLYKGMSHSPAPANHTSSTPRSSMSPQTTGFSQIHSRGGGEGGGQAMSVLLSWHEKVVEIAGAGSVVRTMTDRRTM